MTKGERIKEMLERGCKYPEIMREVGCAGSTIAYHANNMGKRKYSFERKTYDWAAIQAYYDKGHTFVDIEREYGVAWSSIHEAKNDGRLRTTTGQERKKAVSEVRKSRVANGETVGRSKWTFADLCENSPMTTQSVKTMIKEYGLLSQGCSNSNCFLYLVNEPTWAGKPIVLHLDHINGIRNDNRITNLRWLCPNCHSQTDTYCGRNLKKLDETGKRR